MACAVTTIINRQRRAWRGRGLVACVVLCCVVLCAVTTIINRQRRAWRVLCCVVLCAGTIINMASRARGDGGGFFATPHLDRVRRALRIQNI